MVMMGDPFVGNVRKKLTKEELVQALRVDIAGELEAIMAYDAHALAADDERVKTILSSIRDEERQHVGELLHLMEILDPQEAHLLAKGKQEVDQLLGQKGQHTQAAQQVQQGTQAQQWGQAGQGTQAQQWEQAGQGTQAQQWGQTGQGLQPQQFGQGGDIQYQPHPGNLGHRGPHNNWK